jgi:hypothetical protein
LLRVPAPVLAEVCRGSRFDAAVNQLLNREAIGVVDLTREIAQTAGALLAKARLSSAHAIEAFVVATALDFDAAVIATRDAKDIKRLSAPYRQLSLMQLYSKRSNCTQLPNWALNAGEALASWAFAG